MDKFMVCERKEKEKEKENNNNNNNNNSKKRSKNNKSPKLCLGDLITDKHQLSLSFVQIHNRICKL